ncbi:hypothetical protein [Dokdonella sp.]|uniref:hypothetical protein n=1 Tax=Dokdonella sp. TaxID=2291710 RepID=UPI0025C3C77F|nr:hypothetical protein [Dokdonella sp.]MBX3692652.1 hypothetical protein [Dokdonella sp.]
MTQELEGLRLKDAAGREVDPALQARLDAFVKEQRARLHHALDGASESLRSYVSLAEGQDEAA